MVFILNSRSHPRIVYAYPARLSNLTQTATRRPNNRSFPVASTPEGCVRDIEWLLRTTSHGAHLKKVSKQIATTGPLHQIRRAPCFIGRGRTFVKRNCRRYLRAAVLSAACDKSAHIAVRKRTPDYGAETIFVGGRGPSHTQEALELYFAAFGETVQVNVHWYGRAGQLGERGFGFVTFVETSSAAAVLACQPEHVIAGAPVTVRSAHQRPQIPPSTTSNRFRKRDRTRHFEEGVGNIMEQLREGCVGTAADFAAGRELHKQLTQAVRDGIPPSFSDPSALAQYTLDKLRARTWYLYSALLSDHAMLAGLRADLFHRDETTPLQVASVAGGPGFDYTALSIAMSHISVSKPVKCHVYDVNPTWRASLEAVVEATDRERLRQQDAAAASTSEISSAGGWAPVTLEDCDITLPLSHARNTVLRDAVAAGPLPHRSPCMHRHGVPR
ncbi:hypothetical protein CYMTET_29529 [Cymbomonas tetramitiformis]|uniref:RRM domain-containing protein n=1 Tax=Cymbomonas tetramitiformis TaxID=36881 RepID=A0AAE0FL16_9CHLO|nr:hypothetical protein CYMTET_29529 [Cymbomonas tetramitiformis]